MDQSSVQDSVAETGPSGAARSDGLVIRRLVLGLRRHIWLFLALFAVTFGLVAFLTFTTKPKYSASASVMLVKANPDQKPGTSVTPADSATVDTEVQVLQSQQLAQQVAGALSLDRDPEFNPALPKSTVFRPSDVTFDPASTRVVSGDVVGALQRRVSAKRAGLTSVINIAVTSGDPRKAAWLANSMADRYLLLQKANKASDAKGAGESLNERLDRLRRDAANADAAVAAYRREHGIFEGSGAGTGVQEMSNFNQQAAAAKAQYDADQAQLDSARKGDASGVGIDAPAVSQLRSRRGEITATIAQLSDRYGPMHPDVVKAQSELADVDAQLRAEIKRAVGDLEVKARVSRERYASLQGAMGQTRGGLASATTANVALGDLQRSADAARTVYNDFLNRYKQNSAATGTEQADARVLSRAGVPTSPSSPKVPQNLALGVMLGLLVGAGGVFARERLTAGLSDGEAVEDLLGLSYLGSVPLLSSVAEAGAKDVGPVDYVLERPLSSFSEAIRQLRASLRYARMGRPVQVIAITSALPAEGKSTTSVCLARSAALGGSRVLIIDCDLRRRNVGRLLGLEATLGVLDVLSGAATLEQAICHDKLSGADVLSVTDVKVTAREVFDTPAMDALIATARERYDLIVLDTAPTLPVAETRAVAAKADAVVFLARWRTTPEQTIISALRLLDSAGAYIAGVALTQVNMRLEPTYAYAKYKQYYAS